MASPYVIDFHGRWRVAAEPRAVWQAIRQVDSFPQWWPWLSQLEVERGTPSSGGGGWDEPGRDEPGALDEGGNLAGSGSLIEGTVLRGVVSPPLPYRMAIAVRLGRCQPGRRIEATIAGDLVGEATLQLHPDGNGTLTEVAWTIEMRQPAMRAVARLAHPLLRWGHDRVVDATVRSTGLQRALQLGQPPTRLA